MLKLKLFYLDSEMIYQNLIYREIIFNFGLFAHL